MTEYVHKRNPVTGTEWRWKRSTYRRMVFLLTAGVTSLVLSGITAVIQ